MDSFPTTSTRATPHPDVSRSCSQLVDTLDVELGIDELPDRDALALWLRRARTARRRRTLHDGDLERTRTFREALRTLLDEHADEAERTAAAAALDAAAPAALLRVAFDRRRARAPGGRASTARSRSCSRSSTVPRATAPGSG